MPTFEIEIFIETVDTRAGEQVSSPTVQTVCLLGYTFYFQHYIELMKIFSHPGKNCLEVK